MLADPESRYLPIALAGTSVMTGVEGKGTESVEVFFEESFVGANAQGEERWRGGAEFTS